MEQKLVKTDQSQSKSKIIRHPRRKKLGSAKLQQQSFDQYGITRQQLDIILTQLCQQYDCQWTIVSTALYRQHQIRMNESRIKDRYTIYLDPKLKKDGFTLQQQWKIMKLFCVYGNNFREIRQAFPNRDRYMIKGVLEIYMRKALKNIQKYLSKEIEGMEVEDMIGKGEINKGQLLRGLISQSKIPWKYNQSAYKLLYFFTVSKMQYYQQIPKDLALLLYKRLVEMRRERGIQKQQRQKRIDTALQKGLVSKKQENKKKYCKNNSGLKIQSQQVINKSQDINIFESESKLEFDFSITKMKLTENDFDSISNGQLQFLDDIE